MDGGATTLGLLTRGGYDTVYAEKIGRGKNAKTCDKYMYFSKKTD
jgi:hypothetical protein